MFLVAVENFVGSNNIVVLSLFSAYSEETVVVE